MLEIFKLKPFTNIYNILDATFTFFKLLGLVTFERGERKDKTYKYFNPMHKNRMFSIFMLILFYMALTLFTLDTIQKKKVPIIDRSIILFYHYFVTASCTLTLLTFPARTAPLLASFALVSRVDRHLRRLRLAPSLRPAHRFVALVLASFLLLPPASVLLAAFYFNRDAQSQFASDFAFGLPFALTALPLAYWIPLALALRARLRLLGRYLERLRAAAAGGALARQRLLLVADLHQAICAAFKAVTYSVAPQILCLFTFGTVCLTGSLIAVLNLGLEWVKYETLFWTGVCMVILNTVIVLYEYTRYEKVTFLLQILHQQIELNICGYDLNLSKMLGIIGSVTSFCMFLLQLKNATQQETII